MQAQRPVVASQRSPLAHRAPVPHEGPPGHALGTSAPQAVSRTVAGSGHRGMHTQRRASGSQRSPAPQPWSQRPPQPSSAPHAAVDGQLGVQVHRPVVTSQVCRGSAQVPGHRPPQPSSAPQAASGAQRGVHSHRPNTQRSLAPRAHGGSHAQVATQRPFTHTEPAAQVTAAQGFCTQRPSTQNSESAQVTPSQRVRGAQPTWQTVPVGQGAEQRATRAQRPVALSQNSPAGQRTPLQGAGKHPAMQRPLKQVSCAAQRTPSQGSCSGTQRAEHASAPQTFSPFSQGSRAQRPPMQRCPRGQKRSSGQVAPVTTGRSGGGTSGAVTASMTTSKRNPAASE